MKADPKHQQSLLMLQELNTNIRQLEHRSRTSIFAEKISVNDTKLEDIDSELRDVLLRKEDIQRDINRHESDTKLVNERISRDKNHIDLSSSAKDVAALESELVTLVRRKDELETHELELMEQLENLEESAQKLSETRDLQKKERDENHEKLGEELDIISAEILDSQKKIAEIASNIPSELFRLFEQKRTKNRSAAAALLQRKACTGCTMSLTSVDLEKISLASLDDVMFCPDCECILVRTKDSGLL